ncbi:hypothetical protein A3715_02290 [Oleiphilus sp. HI0009]|nr:hypothetical protein A3715_02290 [Oleiphilus sp. HI0009]
MPLASRLSKYIDENAIQCQLVHHARARDLSHAVLLAGAVAECTVRTQLILDRDGPAVLIIPFQSRPDVDAVNRFSGRQFQIIDDEQAGKLFVDCDHGHLPLLAQSYGLTVYVDHSVFELDAIFASSGCANTLLNLPRLSIRAAFHQCNKGDFSESLSAPEIVVHIEKGYSLDDVAKKLTTLYRLPPMPETAVRVMHITSDPNSSVQELAQLVEQDPSLSAQIMRYARSALFNYRGNLTDVKEAINAVLGFERVAKLSLGIASARAFTLPLDGPLGLNALWRHALHSAVLTQALSVMVNPDLGVDEHEAYLSGLLHNFGLLLIGQLFPPEYRMLNKLRVAEPERTMRDIEQQVFGMGAAQEFISLGHGSLGAILLKLWGLPESCIKVAAMHQSPSYEGEHQELVSLVQLSNYLLSLQGVGDEPCSIDFEGCCSALGIDPEQALILADTTVAQCESLDGLVNELVA